MSTELVFVPPEDRQRAMVDYMLWQVGQAIRKVAEVISDLAPIAIQALSAFQSEFALFGAHLWRDREAEARKRSERNRRYRLKTRHRNRRRR